MNKCSQCGARDGIVEELGAAILKIDELNQRLERLRFLADLDIRSQQDHIEALEAEVERLRNYETECVRLTRENEALANKLERLMGRGDLAREVLRDE